MGAPRGNTRSPDALELGTTAKHFQILVTPPATPRPSSGEQLSAGNASYVFSQAKLVSSTPSASSKAILLSGTPSAVSTPSSSPAEDLGGELVNVWEAVQGAKIETLELLFSVNRELVNTTDAQGRTPLIKAAIAGKEDVIRCLLSKRAAINKEEEKTGKTALYYAARAGHLNVVQMLIRNKASASFLSMETTAADVAMEAKQYVVVKKLMSLHAVDCERVLKQAVREDNADFIRYVAKGDIPDDEEFQVNKCSGAVKKQIKAKIKLILQSDSALYTLKNTSLVEGIKDPITKEICNSIKKKLAKLLHKMKEEEISLHNVIVNGKTLLTLAENSPAVKVFLEAQRIDPAIFYRNTRGDQTFHLKRKQYTDNDYEALAQLPLFKENLFMYLCGLTDLQESTGALTECKDPDTALGKVMWTQRKYIIPALFGPALSRGILSEIEKKLADPERHIVHSQSRASSNVKSLQRSTLFGQKESLPVDIPKPSKGDKTARQAPLQVAIIPSNQR